MRTKKAMVDGSKATSDALATAPANEVTPDPIPPRPWMVWISSGGNSVNVSSAVTREFVCECGYGPEAREVAELIVRLANTEAPHGQ